MATVHCLSSSFTLSCKPRNCSISISSCTRSNSATFRSLSFSANLSWSAFINGSLPMRAIERPIHQHFVVCEVAPNKKTDSAAKRARQAEKRRIYNKARKSEVRTRMKKVI